jgi:ligand-binding sensor domain-containing protein
MHDMIMNDNLQTLKHQQPRLMRVYIAHASALLLMPVNGALSVGSSKKSDQKDSIPVARRISRLSANACTMVRERSY